MLWKARVKLFKSICFHLGSGISLLICIATALSYIAIGFGMYCIYSSDRSKAAPYYEVGVGMGRISFAVAGEDAPGPGEMTYRPLLGVLKKFRSFTFMGLSCGKYFEIYFITIPLWMILLASSILPTIWIVKFVRKPRKKNKGFEIGDPTRLP